MTTNTEGLLPCPFCGGEAELNDYTNKPVGAWVLSHKINGCVLRIVNQYSSKQSAIEAWNRRPTAQASEAIRNAALEEAADVLRKNLRPVCAAIVRALSAMPVEPVTNHDDANSPAAVDAPLAITVPLEPTDAMIEAGAKFYEGLSYLSHPLVPYFGTENGDSSDAWRKRMQVALYKAVLAAAPPHAVNEG